MRVAEQTGPGAAVGAGTSLNARTALYYAQHYGWAVFPVHSWVNARCTCGNPECVSPKGKPAKHPRTPNGLLDAVRDAKTVGDWWRRWPEANVGIATGERSGVWVLDIDPRHGGDVALDELLERHGRLPDTVEVLTGGGGRHIYFRRPGTRVACSTGKLGPGLDVKGDGGYVVAPPSTHESGRRYEFEASSRPDATPVAHAPEWLLRLACATDRGTARTPPSQWRALVADGVGEGLRNDSIARLAGLLLQRKVDTLVTFELLRCWNAQKCRPPLSEHELVRTFDSIAALEARKRQGHS